MNPSRCFTRDKRTLIIVNNVMELNRFVAFTVFDTSNGEFSEVRYMKDTKVIGENSLPRLDGFSFELTTKGLIVLGYVDNPHSKKYVVCDGGRLIYYYSKERLESFNVINYDRVIKDDLTDLSHLFETDTVEFVDIPKFSSTGSSGQNVKLLGVHKETGKFGLVKFPLTTRSLDCKNEVVCKNLADLFKVPCCEAIEVSYMGRVGVLSVYDYDRSLGVAPVSLRQYLETHGRGGLINLELLVNNLGKDFKRDYFRSVIFDVLTLQEDRHESNLSINNGKLYPLCDNGRSLLNGNPGQRFSNNYNLVRRLGPDLIKKLINYNVSYYEIFEAISSVYGEDLHDLSVTIAERVHNLLLEVIEEEDRYDR